MQGFMFGLCMVDGGNEFIQGARFESAIVHLY